MVNACGIVSLGTLALMKASSISFGSWVYGSAAMVCTWWEAKLLLNCGPSCCELKLLKRGGERALV
jgi:hypothetical protein